MRKSKRFFSVSWLIFISAFFFAVFTQVGVGGTEGLSNIAGKEIGSRPLRPFNSTYHTDLQLPQSITTMIVGRKDWRPNPWADRLSSSWLKKHLMGGQSQNPQPAGSPTTLPSANDPTTKQPEDEQRFQWKPALIQSFRFLVIEHAFRFATEPGTRAEIKGQFFKDWFQSVRNTRGWKDGDPFIVNYIGHSMQGSVTNYIYVHNDPKSVYLEAGWNRAYFKSRMKAMLFSAIYSTQFELGPLGEAALGNVGLRPTRTAQNPMAYVDLVITPTMGTVWMVSEDALDRFIIKRIEDHVENRVVRLLVRGFLTPSRSFANVLRGRYPWHRDGRRL